MPCFTPSHHPNKSRQTYTQPLGRSNRELAPPPVAGETAKRRCTCHIRWLALQIRRISEHMRFIPHAAISLNILKCYEISLLQTFWKVGTGYALLSCRVWLLRFAARCYPDIGPIGLPAMRSRYHLARRMLHPVTKENEDEKNHNISDFHISDIDNAVRLYRRSVVV